jgi:hypothetical protein
MQTRRLTAALSAPMLAAAIAFGAAPAIAQDATPAAGPATGGNYPVAIHQGTCEQPTAQPAYQLDNTAPFGADQPDAEVLGQPTGVPVLRTSSTIDATLSDVANGGNVVAVHASPEQFGTVIACGQIAGPNIDGELVIALQPVGQSQPVVAGIATLSEDSSGVLGLGDDQIQVTVSVIEVSANSPADPTVATPVAPANAEPSPSAEASATPAA